MAYERIIGLAVTDEQSHQQYRNQKGQIPSLLTPLILVQTSKTTFQALLLATLNLRVARPNKPKANKPRGPGSGTDVVGVVPPVVGTEKSSDVIYPSVVTDGLVVAKVYATPADRDSGPDTKLSVTGVPLAGKPTVLKLLPIDRTSVPVTLNSGDVLNCWPKPLKLFSVTSLSTVR